MGQERRDCADGDLPPPRRLPPLQIILALAGVALLVVMLTAALLFGENPEVRG